MVVCATMRWAWVLIALTACSSSEPEAETPLSQPPPITPEYKAALAEICHAEVRSGALETFPFADKMQTVRAWVEGRISEGSAFRLFFEELPQLPVDDQGATLRSEAKRAGIGGCPTGGLYDFMAELPRKGLGTEDCIAACLKRNSSPSAPDLEARCTSGCGG